MRRRDSVDGNPGADVIRQVLPVELGESGPNRLEYYFEYVSPSERQLFMAWGGANIPIGISIAPPE